MKIEDAIRILQQYKRLGMAELRLADDTEIQFIAVPPGTTVYVGRERVKAPVVGKRTQWNP